MRCRSRPRSCTACGRPAWSWRRGARNGGYVLAAAPERITVMEVLTALGKPLFDSSFCREHGSPDSDSCSRLTDCSLRPVWAHLDALLRQFFTQTTLADLASGERFTRDHLTQRWPLLLSTGRPGAAASLMKETR